MDLKTLCCSGQSVLGVDKTYNLCNMCVTVTCYSQISVIRIKTGEAPIFLGPVFIHDSRHFEMYCNYFFHLEIKLAKLDHTNLVIGSDDERAMVKAILTTFPESTRLHAVQKLTEHAMDKHDKYEIINRLFGLGGISDMSCLKEKCSSLDLFCFEKSHRFFFFFGIFQRQTQSNCALWSYSLS